MARIQDWRTNGMVGQLVRFGITGVGVTLVFSAVYGPIAAHGNQLFFLGNGAEWPTIAGIVAFVVATVVGRIAHSRISFKGHGTRSPRTARRFVVVQMLGFGLNQAFIWLLTGPLVHGPWWWPLVPAVCFTPMVTFGLQRNWVFA